MEAAAAQLDVMPTPSLTYTIRDLGAADVPALAALHVASFAETHAPRGGGPTVALREEQWTHTFRETDRNTFVIGIEAADGRLVGFAKGCAHDGGVPGYAGELNKIYLLRELHRRGLGQRLLLAAAERFLQRGIRSMLLFGDASSAANAFYEALGAERLHSPAGEFHGGYGWTDLTALVASGGAPAA